jgi:outer membrane protein TolC
MEGSTMSTGKSTLMYLAAMLLVACFCIFPLKAQQSVAKDKAVDAQITGTLRQMWKSSTELVTLRKTRYMAGQIDLQLLVTAQRELMELELKLAKTPAERIGVLRTQLRLAADAEKIANAKLLSGRTTKEDVLQAQIARLRIEVRILEEKI